MTNRRTTQTTSPAAPVADARGPTLAPGAVEGLCPLNRADLLHGSPSVVQMKRPATDTEHLEFEKDLKENPPYTWADLRDYTPDKSTYLVGEMGWIRRGFPTAFIGWAGQGKSVLLEQICVQLASGQDLFGKIRVFKPLKVLLIECENGKDTIARDMQAIMKFTKANSKLVAKNLIIVSDWKHKDQLFGPFLVDLLLKFAPDIVIIDNLQGYMSTDPNKAETFNDWIDPVLHAIKAANCGLIITDHAPKPPKVGNTEKDLDMSLGAYLGSGTARKANWARTSFELINFTRNPRYRLNFSKSGQWAGIKDETGKPTRHFFLEQSGIPEEPYWKLAEDQAPPVRASKYGKQIRIKLKENSQATNSEIARELHCTRSTVWRFRKNMRP